jgi:hypothetical protein
LHDIVADHAFLCFVENNCSLSASKKSANYFVNKVLKE